jgi:hypothetical protein
LYFVGVCRWLLDPGFLTQNKASEHTDYVVTDSLPESNTFLGKALCLVGVFATGDM